MLNLSQPNFKIVRKASCSLKGSISRLFIISLLISATLFYNIILDKVSKSIMKSSLKTCWT